MKPGRSLELGPLAQGQSPKLGRTGRISTVGSIPYHVIIYVYIYKDSYNIKGLKSYRKGTPGGGIWIIADDIRHDSRPQIYPSITNLL